MAEKVKVYRLEVHELATWTVLYFATKAEADAAFREYNKPRYGYVGLVLDSIEVEANRAGLVRFGNSAQETSSTVETRRIRKTGTPF